MKKRPHFTATLTYLATEEGGIVTPVSSGFRCIVRFPYDNTEFLANQTFIDTELVFPGDIINADINLVGNPEILGKIYEGMDFDLFLNDNAIGNGVITTIYDKEND
jgi:translation elongation factor EF-Tu-like GTPase